MAVVIIVEYPKAAPKEVPKSGQESKFINNKVFAI